MAITVTVVDDHPAIRTGVRAWYADAEQQIDVIAEGAGVDVAWTSPGGDADVVVLDLNVEREAASYRSTVRRLVDVGRKVIVYTMQESQDVALSCLDLGVCAFLTKAEGDAHLVAATVSVAQNRPYLAPALAGAIVANQQANRPRLSDREQEVLTLWFQCESKQLVADRMCITPRTVGTYLDRVRIKYANVGRPAPTKAALLARAIQDGLVDVDDL
ncbi:LuxR family two component transcriptional regulator [Herbihabitans rhizosphaerae]|uniref:LuxR family two component transcriptional regulator n=1 Tax=Herbihabitans rhizosphaerae TaxID=1872711 RepID=A0A4Q7KIL0_9PSEU|nr:response regulator transcription factor [Herbihabitans rhizosphaerae]RZS36388.1 LuxR family two component transcriptional regulator [Herbihabitans rhizosphaerae]